MRRPVIATRIIKSRDSDGEYCVWAFVEGRTHNELVRYPKADYYSESLDEARQAATTMIDRTTRNEL